MIKYGDSTITLPRSMVMPGGEPSANLLGAFLDAGANQLYTIASANQTGPFYWRRIDLTNLLAPAAHDWAVSDLSCLSNAGDSDDLGDQDILFLDTGTNFAYLVWNALDSESSTHLMIARVDMATGIVTYGAKQLLTQIGTVDTKAPVRGVVVTNRVLYVLRTALTGASSLGMYDLDSIPFQADFIVPTGDTNGLVAMAQRTALANAQEGFVPVGLTLAADGKLLVFYDDAGKVEKYNVDLTYEGVTTWVATDIGSIFYRSGLIFSLNDVDTGEAISLKRWNDLSTGTVSDEKSIYLVDDRQIRVGENDVVLIRFIARDGFGAPMPQVAGQFCRFEIVTSRGALDSDDSALSTSAAPDTFRDSDGIPFNRFISVPFDETGVATAYFQSVRTSSEPVVLDTLRIDYP